MAETYPSPRFGAPREPKSPVNPGSRLVLMLDIATAMARIRRHAGEVAKRTGRRRVGAGIAGRLRGRLAGRS